MYHTTLTLYFSMQVKKGGKQSHFLLATMPAVVRQVPRSTLQTSSAAFCATVQSLVVDDALPSAVVDADELVSCAAAKAITANRGSSEECQNEIIIHNWCHTSNKQYRDHF